MAKQSVKKEIYEKVECMHCKHVKEACLEVDKRVKVVQLQVDANGHECWIDNVQIGHAHYHEGYIDHAFEFTCSLMFHYFLDCLRFL